jgi:N-acetylmuramic acid 6-phosphate etherase
MTRPAVRVVSPTEAVNPRTSRIDEVPTLDLVHMLNDEDRLVADAVAAALPELARLVDAAVDRVSAGGRVHYFGAGTSGRLGVLDAAELPPTFGVAPDEVVVAHLAGGPGAVRQALEDAEDDRNGQDAAGLSVTDVVIGVAASGRTPYVGAALTAGRTAGAVTALVTSNPQPPLAELADHLLVADTGPEAITGSTRLKAGTAAKLILHTFSTALMVRLGHTYGNFMIDMLATNAKLRGRSVGMLVQATGESEQRCAEALDLCGDRKTALVHLLAQAGPAAGAVTPDRCRDALRRAGGRVREALVALSAPA